MARTGASSRQTSPTEAQTRRRLTKRKLFGFDRSGPEPPQTRRGQPLRPLTIPNLVGYARLAAIPVFLVLAMSSEDGRTTAAALVFLFITAGDFLDGLLARVTGQYSRMGALLDPVVDRLAILAGVAVCWRFELLPRWALAILVARELVTVVLAQMALRRGIDVEINWVGRLAVFPIMGSVFLAMFFDSVVIDAMLIAGTAAAVVATVIYARSGLRRSTAAATGGSRSS